MRVDLLRYFSGPRKDFTGGAVPGISGEEELADLQTDAFHLCRAFRHAELDVSDDFVGSSGELVKWTGYLGTITMVGADADANGSVQLITSGSPSRVQLATQTLNEWGTLDFYYSARPRLVSIAGGVCDFGSLLVNSYAFRADPSVGVWVVFAQGVPHNTTVVLGSGYARLEIFRFNNVAYFRIDGVLVYEEILSTYSIGGETWGVRGSHISADIEVWLDSMRVTVLGAH